MNREAQKKMLIVQGIVHRLALAQATQQVKANIRPSSMVSRLPALFALLTRNKALSLVSTAVTLLAGRSRVPRILRRAMVAAGAASALAVFISRWKSRKEQTGDNAD